MPHINIKHFPHELNSEQTSKLVNSITIAIQTAFDCKENVISISAEPIKPESWNQLVYSPEIENKKEFLLKFPHYGAE